eukprot:GHVN01104088.1.p1 GENE.GHVN01104088.1~~GHVN01104088.1.p1  ORF type:complete len:2548 (+),score=548.97 GHVN01104088.1:965-7645(+)
MYIALLPHPEWSSSYSDLEAQLTSGKVIEVDNKVRRLFVRDMCHLHRVASNVRHKAFLQDSFISLWGDYVDFPSLTNDVIELCCEATRSEWSVLVDAVQSMGVDNEVLSDVVEKLLREQQVEKAAGVHSLIASLRRMYSTHTVFSPTHGVSGMTIEEVLRAPINESTSLNSADVNDKSGDYLSRVRLSDYGGAGSKLDLLQEMEREMKRWESVDGAKAPEVDRNALQNMFETISIDTQSDFFDKLRKACLGCKLAVNLTPRAHQLWALLLLCGGVDEQECDRTGVLLEVNTGEGKSLIVALFAVIKWMEGHKVDVLTTATDLVEEGVSRFQSLYDLFNINVGMACGLKKSKRPFMCDVLHGTPMSFQGTLLSDRMRCEGDSLDRPANVAIVDEVDSLFIDRLDDSTILSSPYPGMEYCIPVFPLIWNFACLVRDKTEFNHLTNMVILHHGDGPPDEVEPAMLTELIINQAVHICSKYSFPLHISDLIKDKLCRVWGESAARAMWVYKQDRDYAVSDGMICPIDRLNTGEVFNNRTFDGGLDQFLRLKHGLAISAPSLTSVVMSNVSFFQRYTSLYGLSGTLGSPEARSQLKEMYKAKCIDVPPFNKKRMHMIHNLTMKSREEWLVSIRVSCEYHINLGRPVLVLCESISDLHAVHVSITESEVIKEREVFKYSRSEDYQAEGFPKVLNEGNVIVATNIAGRGTDFKLSKPVANNGGLHVILTSIPMNSRVEQQNIGRAGRQGQKGSGQMLVMDTRGTPPPLLKIERNAEQSIRLSHNSAKKAAAERVDKLVQSFCSSLKVVPTNPAAGEGIEKSREAVDVHFENLTAADQFARRFSVIKGEVGEEKIETRRTRHGSDGGEEEEWIDEESDEVEGYDMDALTEKYIKFSNTAVLVRKANFWLNCGGPADGGLIRWAAVAMFKDTAKTLSDDAAKASISCLDHVLGESERYGDEFSGFAHYRRGYVTLRADGCGNMNKTKMIAIEKARQDLIKTREFIRDQCDQLSAVSLIASGEGVAMCVNRRLEVWHAFLSSVEGIVGKGEGSLQKAKAEAKANGVTSAVKLRLHPMFLSADEESGDRVRWSVEGERNWYERLFESCGEAEEGDEKTALKLAEDKLREKLDVYSQLREAGDEERHQLTEIVCRYSYHHHVAKVNGLMNEMEEYLDGINEMFEMLMESADEEKKKAHDEAIDEINRTCLTDEGIRLSILCMRMTAIGPFTSKQEIPLNPFEADVAKKGEKWENLWNAIKKIENEKRENVASFSSSVKKAVAMSIALAENKKPLKQIIREDGDDGDTNSSPNEGQLQSAEERVNAIVDCLEAASEVTLEVLNEEDESRFDRGEIDCVSNDKEMEIETLDEVLLEEELCKRHQLSRGIECPISRSVIAEFEAQGCPTLLKISFRNKIDWTNFAIVCCLGIGQVLVGIVLLSCAPTIGLTLLLEGLSDLSTAYDSCIVQRNFSWKSYGMNKAISVIVTLVSASTLGVGTGVRAVVFGVARMKAKEVFNSVMEKGGKEIFEQLIQSAQKPIRQLAKSIIDAVWGYHDLGKRAVELLKVLGSGMVTAIWDKLKKVVECVTELCNKKDDPATATMKVALGAVDTAAAKGKGALLKNVALAARGAKIITAIWGYVKHFASVLGKRLENSVIGRHLTSLANIMNNGMVWMNKHIEKLRMTEVFPVKAMIESVMRQLKGSSANEKEDVNAKTFWTTLQDSLMSKLPAIEKMTNPPEYIECIFNSLDEAIVELEQKAEVSLKVSTLIDKGLDMSFMAVNLNIDKGVKLAHDEIDNMINKGNQQIDKAVESVNENVQRMDEVCVTAVEQLSRDIQEKVTGVGDAAKAKFSKLGDVACEEMSMAVKGVQEQVGEIESGVNDRVQLAEDWCVTRVDEVGKAVQGQASELSQAAQGEVTGVGDAAKANVSKLGDVACEEMSMAVKGVQEQVGEIESGVNDRVQLAEDWCVTRVDEVGKAVQGQVSELSQAAQGQVTGVGVAAKEKLSEWGYKAKQHVVELGNEAKKKVSETQELVKNKAAKNSVLAKLGFVVDRQVNKAVAWVKKVIEKVRSMVGNAKKFVVDKVNDLVQKLKTLKGDASKTLKGCLNHSKAQCFNKKLNGLTKKAKEIKKAAAESLKCGVDLAAKGVGYGDKVMSWVADVVNDPEFVDKMKNNLVTTATVMITKFMRALFDSAVQSAQKKIEKLTIPKSHEDMCLGFEKMSQAMKQGATRQADFKMMMLN